MRVIRYLIEEGLIFLPLLLTTASLPFSQGSTGFFYQVQSISATDLGIIHPVGLAYSPSVDVFYVLERPSQVNGISSGPQIVRFNMLGDRVGSNRLNVSLPDSLNLAFSRQTNSLYFLDQSRKQLVQFHAGPDGEIPDSEQGVNRFDTGLFDAINPQGMAFDPDRPRLFILDAAGPAIISVEGSPLGIFGGLATGWKGRIGRINIDSLVNIKLHGIAYNPMDGHLYVLGLEKRILYELSETGRVLSQRNLMWIGLRDPQGMVFAPSADQTDNPSQMSLYLVDAGSLELVEDPENINTSMVKDLHHSGQIVELSLRAPASLPPGTALLPTNLVQIIDTSNAEWNPSAPDPAGVDYWPLTGNLLISDSEVEEMPPYWQGKNVFQATTAGTLVDTCHTTSYSNEPTGVAINPDNNHVFFSDDTGSNDKVFEINLGADGIYCTEDDTVTIINVASLVGATDAEDVAYGNNTLFIADGINAEVYSIPLGPDGVLGGGDDGPVTHFDTASLGFSAVEGIGYNDTNDTLFIVSPQNTEKYLGETTTTGTLIRAFDLPYAGLTHKEDVALAPGSQNPGIRTIYIADRGIDNNNDPNENDGEIYELEFEGATATVTNTASPIATELPTLTSTPTPTDTITPSPSPTPTDTPTFTSTPPLPPTLTSTNTGTPTPSLTPSSTPSPPASNTPQPSLTATNLPTVTSTLVLTSTSTETKTITNTPIIKVTETLQPSPTSRDTSIPSNTPTPTSGLTRTPTPTDRPGLFTQFSYLPLVYNSRIGLENMNGMRIAQPNRAQQRGSKFTLCYRL